MLEKILSFASGEQNSRANFLDVTAGGGGHFLALMKARANWSGECWDKDPLALERLAHIILSNHLTTRAKFVSRSFGEGPLTAEKFTFILADLGVSSFQLDDHSRGMSLFSKVPADFRMNPAVGLPLYDWLQSQSLEQLVFFLEEFGEEPRAKYLAKEMKSWSSYEFETCERLAATIEKTLAYRSPSRTHPATRTFQALRIAVNDELGELKKLLKWAPQALAAGGILAIISFHSVEDRAVKNAFRALAEDGGFEILTKKPLEADEQEVAGNPRARSAKLRVLKRRV